MAEFFSVGATSQIFFNFCWDLSTVRRQARKLKLTSQEKP